MSILKTSKLGNPVLRQVAKSVSVSELLSPATQKLIDDMIETMHEYEGVGLAAPQVHESKQIAVIEALNSKRYPDSPNVPLMVLVNPVFLSLSEESIDGWEGCLSVDGFRGKVPRSTRVSIRFMDRAGQEEELDTEGFQAVVIQHELDHLAGKIYLDRMRDLTTLAHMKEFERFCIKDEDED